jgi:hypothetical protein
MKGISQASFFTGGYFRIMLKLKLNTSPSSIINDLNEGVAYDRMLEKVDFNLFSKVNGVLPLTHSIDEKHRSGLLFQSPAINSSADQYKEQTCP